MKIAWIIGGVILGWISIEFVAAATKVRMPMLFNLGMAFIGGLIAFTILR